MVFMFSRCCGLHQLKFSIAFNLLDYISNYKILQLFLHLQLPQWTLHMLSSLASRTTKLYSSVAIPSIYIILCETAEATSHSYLISVRRWHHNTSSLLQKETLFPLLLPLGLSLFFFHRARRFPSLESHMLSFSSVKWPSFPRSSTLGIFMYLPIMLMLRNDDCNYRRGKIADVLSESR